MKKGKLRETAEKHLRKSGALTIKFKKTGAAPAPSQASVSNIVTPPDIGAEVSLDKDVERGPPDGQYQIVDAGEPHDIEDEFLPASESPPPAMCVSTVNTRAEITAISAIEDTLGGAVKIISEALGKGCQTEPAPSAHKSFGQVMEQILSQASHGSQALASLNEMASTCLLYTSPSPRDATLSRMPSSA